jgi:NADH-quinone oxidoreductase subunit D/NADH-quinone oxidoreductase subunit C/D
MGVVLDGEIIVALKPVMGYLHRNHEKIGERNTYLGNMPFTDRLDYLSSMANNFSYAVAVEKMLGDKVEVPERAEYLRVIMAELTRVSNHIWAIGFLLNDLGAYFTPTLYATEERELILDIFEATAGSRMMCNYFRFGGVSRDIPEEYFEKLKRLVSDRLPRKVDDLDRYLTDNEIIKERCEGVGVLTPDEAIAYGASGPVLRASGVPYDIRRAEPYGIYDRFDFDVAVGYHGDTYDRYLVRMFEVRQSLKILAQAVRDIPEGPVIVKNPYNVRVPAGEAYGRTEAPKGELGFYLVSDGTANPFRYHIRSPSFINLTALEKMCVGGKIADAVAVLGSIDIVLGEVDR